MSDEFELRTGSVALGDPVMELAVYGLGLASGRYRLEKGALQKKGRGARGGSAIELDGPYVFAMDAELAGPFGEWFHAVGKECRYDVVKISQRLGEFETKHDAAMAFYWEEDVAGRAREGTYVLNSEAIQRVA